MLLTGLIALAFAAGATTSPPPAAAPEIVPVANPPSVPLRRLPMRVSGRVVPLGREGVRRQWPGSVFRTAFRGPAALFRVGPGEVSLRVSVDGGPAAAMVRPVAGYYRVGGLAPRRHQLQVAVASEAQAGPTDFGGFFHERGTHGARIDRPRRGIEFIGDSHTVGYGNASSTQTCTPEEVWATTDGTQGIAPLTAGRYGADYRVNAISGRGIVRNYNGFSADTLPQAYPFTLFKGTHRAADRGWRPQVIVVALGTNDFSTALNPGERWATREQLHADYENTYVAFLNRIRARHRDALLVLWATDMASGEIAAEEGRVVERMQAEGDRRIAFVAVHGLRLAGCHGHPDLADDRTIAAAVAGVIDRAPDIWRGR